MMGNNKDMNAELSYYYYNALSNNHQLKNSKQIKTTKDKRQHTKLLFSTLPFSTNFPYLFLS